MLLKFCEEVVQKMESLHPEWIKKGGCGLITPSGMSARVANDDISSDIALDGAVDWQ
jgi:hypothetical protein